MAEDIDAKEFAWISEVFKQKEVLPGSVTQSGKL